MSNTEKTMEIAGEVLRKFFTEKIEREWVPLTSTQSQELFGKTERLEAENKRLQEREWVGLTDEELYCNDARSQEDLDYGRLVEAKLKEKNCG